MSDPVPAETGRPRTAKTKLSEIVLVCAKCAKRQSVGKRAVRRLLKSGLKGTHPKRKVRIVETGCLGPCPKRALAVATGASLARGRVVLLDPAATPESAIMAILPEFGPKAALAPGSETGKEPVPLT
ncbi:(2Fe-2S) ferredoxin domain-containing protein [Methylobacterium durans]|uniref:(2Fe-2S) ferredoxin domain-containing protein n=1 Tax=Methylobacterium durans TaxID=2202825 RepID=UPI001F1A5C91|nr:(2Fe-2S) ferredoxin domain-containing protein [Methylobacterium durans]